MPFGIRTSRPIYKANFLRNWFISVKRHHNTEVEQVLKTESIAMMAFCCTSVRLSFLFFFTLSVGPVWCQILLGGEEGIWKMCLHVVRSCRSGQVGT